MVAWSNLSWKTMKAKEGLPFSLLLPTFQPFSSHYSHFTSHLTFPFLTFHFSLFSSHFLTFQFPRFMSHFSLPTLHFPLFTSHFSRIGHLRADLIGVVIQMNRCNYAKEFYYFLEFEVSMATHGYYMLFSWGK